MDPSLKMLRSNSHSDSNLDSNIRTQRNSKLALASENDRLKPFLQDTIHLLRPLHQRPMSCIHFTACQVRNELLHGCRQLWTQDRITCRGDEQGGYIDGGC